MNLLTVLGATCSGKSKMAIEIAQKYIILGQKVAVVNCDSRQIYENLNIGTAKIPGIWQNFKSEMQTEIKNEKENLICKKSEDITQNLFKKQTQNAFFWENIPHFLIDFVPINSDYSLVNFVQDWCSLITFWQQNNSFDLVILVGGTGLWAKAIVENYDLGIIKKQHLKTWQKNKTELQNLSLENLQQKYLTKLAKIEKDLKITKNFEQNKTQNKTQIKLKTTLKKIKNQIKNQTENSANIESVEQNSTNNDLFLLSKKILIEMKNLNNSDFQNPIRLINWLLRYKVIEKNWKDKINYPKFDKTQVVAIKTNKTELNQKIKKSVQSRIKQGLLKEVKNLVENFDRQKIWNLGLEYRESLRLLDKEINLETWENNLIMQNEQYAKRQITWLNKEKLEENLVWIKDLEELEKLLVQLEF